MKFGAVAFASAAGAFVLPASIPEGPEKTLSHHEEHQEHQHHDHDHHESAWLKFIPDKVVTAYDDAVDALSAGADNAGNAVHSWVDNALAGSVLGGHHGHHGHDDDDEFRSRTIYQIINDNKHTTRFAKLINERQNLVELLNSTETNSTLFVPIDEAFEHIPDDDDHKPSDEFVDKLLAYHIGVGNFPVKNIIDTHTFPTHLKEPLLGGEPQRLRIRVGFTGVRVNFYSKVVKAVESKNGIVAAVRNILVPPPAVGRELSLFPDRFSTLLLAYDKTEFVKFVHGLKMNGSTVFAPSNNAFHRLGPKANAFLFNTEHGLDYLKAILKYHIAPNATLYSDTFYDKAGAKEVDASGSQPQHFDLETLLKDARVGVDIGKFWGFITVRVNAFNKVVVQDGIAKNGVIHVVDKVLLPPHKRGDHKSSDDEDEEISVAELKERLAPWVTEREPSVEEPEMAGEL